MNKIGWMAVITALGVTLAVSAGPWTKGEARHRPRLFKRFGEILNTPDGLVMDARGNVYLSAVNVVDGTYPGHIWRMDAVSGKWSVFTPCKPHPQTGAAYPMGLAFDHDGNIYTGSFGEKRALVVNIDAPSPFMINTKPDAVHTLSVIEMADFSVK